MQACQLIKINSVPVFNSVRKFSDHLLRCAGKTQLVQQPHFILNNGRRIPALGFGTYDSGYRHIDGAAYYENEVEVGDAIKRGMASQGLKRDDIFITTKLWCNNLHPSKVRAACERSVKELGLDYVDLYLVHFPAYYKLKPGMQFTLEHPDRVELQEHPLEEVWKAMEDLVAADLTKSIGVSNFNKKQIERMLAICKIPPAVNQIEVSVNFLNTKMIDFCKSKNILVQGYAPFGSPGVMVDKIPSLFDEPYVKEIAEAHNKKPAQVLLRHAIQRGIVILAKSVTAERVKANFDIFDFELTDAEMEKLNTSGRNKRLFDFLAFEKHPEYPFKDEY